MFQCTLPPERLWTGSGCFRGRQVANGFQMGWMANVEMALTIQGGFTYDSQGKRERERERSSACHHGAIAEQEAMCN